MLTSYNGKDLIEIVGAVYDSIAEEVLWQDTLDQVRQACEGYIATLGVIDAETNQTRSFIACGNAHALKPIANLPASDYTFLPVIMNMELDVPYKMSTFYAAQGPESRSVLLKSRLYKEWVIPHNVDDCIWVPMVKTSQRTGNLVVVTERGRGKISQDDLAMMGQLSPHIRRAVTIGDLFEFERGKGEVFKDIIEALRTPVLIVSGEMQVLYANQSAEQMLKESRVLSTLRGRLDFKFRLAGNAIEHAVATSKKDEFTLGPNGINVPLLRAGTPAVAHVMPLTRRDHPHRVSQKAVAAIFIASAGSAPIPAMDAIGALFGLTPAEKNIASHIAAGRKTTEISEMNGASENTIRTHIRALFDKTGTSDQRNFSLLIKELTPPVRAG
jgi:DNA-binding CsgD family transcriptional regulator/PAS domain-containing protein